jgi:hypothetical protein
MMIYYPKRWFINLCEIETYRIKEARGNTYTIVQNIARKRRVLGKRKAFDDGSHIGDSVVVKPGILDPEFRIDIGGWQGRIKEIDDENTVFIRWDSITLLGISRETVIRCENENLEWEVMTLEKDEVALSTARDSEADVDRVAFQLKMEMMGDPRLEDERYYQSDSNSRAVYHFFGIGV